MLRTSSYTIYVDLPENQEEMLLVHGYTGAYDRVSRRVVDYLRLHEARRPPKPLYGEWAVEPEGPVETTPPPPEVIALLRQRGYLTPLTLELEEELFVRLAQKLHRRATQRMPSYIFMPTYDCNLRCAYCFQDHLRTDPRFRHLLIKMSRAVIARIFRALPKIEAHHGIEPHAVPGTPSSWRRNIGFFGGEPLLKANRPAITAIMEHARALGPADFWAVTNGTELEAYQDLLGPGQLARLQITLDGPPAEHDRRRIRADGTGTFAQIAANITLALERGARMSIRLNIDSHNLSDLPALAAAIRAQGWHQSRGFSVYTAPIHAANPQTPRETTLNSWELDQAITALRAAHPDMAIIGRPDEGIRGRARQIFSGEEELLPQLRPSFCGAHEQMYIFDPLGDVYACWERTADTKIRIAHITPGGDVEFQVPVKTEWRSRSVASNPVCRRCRYALHCGGGCAILALGQRGKFHANFCDGFASRFRASLAEAWQSLVAGTELHPFEESLCDL